MPSRDASRSTPEPDQPVLFEESVSLDDLVQQSRQDQEPDGAELPCAINGLTSGLSGGVLGYAFGFVPKVVTHRGTGRWQAGTRAGWESAKTFAILGGLYTFVSCFSKRLRMKDDGINNGLAGCATGLALGWKGGPLSAAQSCVGFGLFSLVFDYLGGGAAQAISLSHHQGLLQRQQHSPVPGTLEEAFSQFTAPVAALLTPAATGLRPYLAPCSGAGACVRPLRALMAQQHRRRLQRGKR